MQDFTLTDGPAKERVQPNFRRVLHQIVAQWLGHFALSDDADAILVDNEHNAESGLTQPHYLVEHRVEHGREVAWGRIDDSEHLGGRGLLFQGFACLSDE